ncbi:nitrophenyl compound nitroreductase subunit ArsF family protein [Bacteroidota bacterium]
MKIIQVLLFTVVALSMNLSCQAQTDNSEKDSKVSKTGEVEVFYFHYTRRCVTCKAVEDVSKEAIAELYGETISFTGYNLDEQEGKDKGQDLAISGQTLLIVSGDTKINITNEGFMYARSNPEKFKQIISEKVNSLL